MRIYAVLMFILCVNLASALVTSLGLFDTAPATYNSQIIDTLNSTFTNQSYLNSNVGTISAILQGGQDFITAFWVFTKLFVMSVLLPKQMFMNFGVPENIALYFTFPVYLIYLTAIVQFLSGRFLE